MPQILQFLVVASLTLANVLGIEVGDAIPSVNLHQNFPPDSVNLSEHLANKNAIIVPGYIDHQDALAELGVDEVLIYCVNDAAVMTAWSEDQGVDEEDMVVLMADPYAELTKALDMELTHPGPIGVGLVNRCKRFALYVEKGIVKIVRVAEAEDDPAGDDFPDITLADAMAEAIQEFKESATPDEL